MGILGNMTDRFFGMFGYFRSDANTRANVYSARVASFAANEMMYDNTIYQFGMRGIMSECLGWNEADFDTKRIPNIAGHFNPAKEIVDTYQNVMRGTWGKELKVTPQDQNATLPTPLADALTKIWRDSNLDTAKQSLQQWCANLGTVGMRPVSDPDTQQIRIHIDHPSRLFTIEEDPQGNAESVVLKYKKPHNYGTALEPDFQMMEVIEQINKDEFSMTFEGVEQIADDARANTFGFCPYVIQRHKDNGTLYGDWAYKGCERIIHDINYKISRQGRSIDRHLFPNWFSAASGVAPKSFDLEEEKMTYVQQPSGAPTPILEPLVAKIDHANAQSFWMELRDMLRGRQPELTINDVRLLAGISGETLAKVLVPAEAALLSVRPGYEHAIIRVLQMALSIGCDLSLWDIGAGMGAGAGDRSYKTGKEEFVFADRPALPQTVYDKVQQANADTAEQSAKLDVANKAGGIVDQQKQLELAGFKPKEVTDIMHRKNTVDVIPTEQL